MAALASEADWVFIPECPPEAGWQDTLCKKLAAVSLNKFRVVNSYRCTSWGVFNTTFNNISVVSVKETGGPGENHRPAATH